MNLGIRNHIVLSTNYKHHSEYGGYNQLAKYTLPAALIGINENTPPNILLKKYKWLYEYVVKIKYNPTLLHIYYAEEYLRFAPYLFNHIPIVATFHQPPANLEREVVYGDYSGRVGKFTHTLTKDRFKKLAAAIILEENQREILEQVMPAEKIHLIPHGVHPALFEKRKLKVDKKHVLTVGNWQRDWQLYINVLEHFLLINPELPFLLVNKSLPEDLLSKFSKFKNFKYLKEISDSELRYLYETSYCMFLPLISATANNSLIESLAFGCQVVTSNVFSSNYPFKGSYIRFCNNIEEYVYHILSSISLSSEQRTNYAHEAKQDISELVWPSIAQKFKSLYKNLIVSNKYDKF